MAKVGSIIVLAIWIVLVIFSLTGIIETAAWAFVVALIGSVVGLAVMYWTAKDEAAHSPYGSH